MKGPVILTLCIISGMAMHGQELTEKTFYDSSWNTTDSIKAAYFEIITYADSSKKAALVKRWHVSGQLKSETPYSDISKAKRHGIEWMYYSDGRLRSKCQYVAGKLDGDVTTWYPSGQVKRRDVYKNDSLLSGQCFGNNGKDTTYFNFMVNGGYKGGHQVMASFVRRNVVYPQKAKSMGIEGFVLIQFILDKNGKPTNEKIISKTDPIINEEALRVFSLMKTHQWIPAQMDGELVTARMILPVGFKLSP